MIERLLRFTEYPFLVGQGNIASRHSDIALAHPILLTGKLRQQPGTLSR